MSSKDDASGEQPADSGPNAFQGRPGDRGLSLNELSEAFAEMLGGGHDPYQVQASADAADPFPEPAAAGEQDPAAGQAGCEISPRSILEAMLFVGSPTNEPLTSDRVASLMRGVRPAEIDDLVRDLNRQYQACGCPYHIAGQGAGYRLVLHETFDRIRGKFYGRVRHARLSPAAIEVLALIAYNGSLTAEQVARLRGTSSGSILSLLVRRQLLRIERRQESPRTPHYYTTGRFLEVFGLESLDDLPRSEELDKR
jgi:segregation and condensation protein B